MTTRALCASLALAAMAAQADVASNVYTVVVNGGTRAAPVSIEGQQIEIYDAEADTTTTAEFGSFSFKPNSIFRKRGTGYMLSSLGMSSFTGEIRIEEGAFVINTNNQMGVTTAAANAPLIVVSNGASFVMSTRADTCAAKALKIYNKFLIAGDGVDGIGAICCDNTTSQMDALFHSNWTLTDDASFGTTTTARSDYGYGDIDLAGHVLTARRVTETGTFCMEFGARFVNSAGTPSRVVFNHQRLQFQLTSSSDTWPGDERSEIVFTNSGSFSTYANYARIPWTMRICGSVSAVPGGAASTAKTPGVLSGNRWCGPVVLDGTGTEMNISISSNYDGDGIIFTNLISGAGGITAANAALQLGCATNTFAGPLSVRTDTARRGFLALWHGQSLPAASAGLTVTNAMVALTAIGERYDLPPTEVYVRAGTNISFYGGSGGFVPSFRKTGPGQLDLTAPLTVTGRAEVAEGVLKLARYAGAGLVSGALLMPDRVDINLPDKHYTASSTAAYETTCNLTNRVEISPLCFTASSQGVYQAPSPAPGKVPGVIVMYNGYIWNRTGETQRWTFGGGFGTHTNVKLDNTWLYRITQYQTGQKKTVDVKPGPHRLRVTTYNTGTNSYISVLGYSFTNMTWKVGGSGAGLRYDPNGRDSANVADYVKIEDPGDGSLLTVTTNDTLTTVYDRPSFHALRLAPGTTLDIFGNSIAVGDLEGLGMITNSNAYYNYPLTVTNSWKVSAADVAAGGVLRVHAPLAFAAGTTFAAENLADFPHSEEPIVLCVADAPIEGMPTFDRLATNATRKWKLVKSVDGKSIGFEYSCGTSLILR